jgi:hypothetical protein
VGSSATVRAKGMMDNFRAEMNDHFRILSEQICELLLDFTWYVKNKRLHSSALENTKHQAYSSNSQPRVILEPSPLNMRRKTKVVKQPRHALQNMLQVPSLLCFMPLNSNMKFLFKKCLRSHINYLLDIKKPSDVPKSISQEVLDAFVKEGGPGPTEHEFALAWEGEGKKEWNAAAAKVFEASFLQTCEDGFWLNFGVSKQLVEGIDIAFAFRMKLVNLGKRFGSKMTKVDREKLLNKRRKHSRRHGVCNR